MKQSFTVDAQDADIRLDRWMKRHLPHVPHAMLQKALRKGDVRLDGKKVEASERVFAGQAITVAPHMLKTDAPKPAKPTASQEKLKEIQRWVIYKDENVIAINKPAGLAVQGGTKQYISVDHMLDGLRFDAKERPKLVHRLDKDTSGVLLLGRSAKAASVLAAAFSGKEIEKTYWALVAGVPQIGEGKIDMPLSKAVRGKDSRTEASDYEDVGVDEEKGKRAVTYYRIIESNMNFAWVELFPETGRTHQLRVHMAETGTPIIGDGKYGGSQAFVTGMEFSRSLHLHARRIRLSAFGKKLDIEAPMPKHMKESFKSLGFNE